MKKIKLDKKAALSIAIFIAVFVAYVLVVVRFQFYYGSTLDWESQHSVIPDYFRMLFYKTHDLFPDFAFNLGNGQNIYNFAYYGLLSPIVLFSYLFPSINMIDYLVVANIASVVVSTVGFYIWLRKNHRANHFPAFLASIVFMFATSLSFHSHRHVMFVNYMPFMILGLFGVDKKLHEGKGWLLSLSIFAMIMTSYYYSVGGIIALVLYGIYVWIAKTDKISFKKFFKDGISFLLPIIVGILMAAIILLPTFHVILSSRGETFNSITWKDLFIPKLNISYMLYETYGIGLTAIAIMAIVYLLFNKRENLYLGIVLSLMITFPFVNYLLNATMYVDAKAFIPMLPLAVFGVYIFINAILSNEVFWKKMLVVISLVSVIVVFNGQYVYFYLIDLVILLIFFAVYTKLKRKWLLAIPIILIPIAASISASLNDELVNYEKAKNLRAEFKEVLSSITDNDKSKYRISNAKTILRDVNNLYNNINYNTSTIYSSTYNLDYNRFYYDVINNPIQNRNRVITSPTANLLFLMYSSNKYLIDNNANYFGYELLNTVSGDKIYKNENVLPIMYVQSKAMNLDDFEKLGHPEKAVALLKRAIVKDAKTDSYSPIVQKFDFEESAISLGNAQITKKDEIYTVNADKKTKILYNLPEEYYDKIVFVRFKVLESASCSEGDTEIHIDGVSNKLTCKSWKYHNQNYQFDYVLANKNKTSYEIEFWPGEYQIKDIELYAIDYDDIKNVKEDIDEFIFDESKTSGDKIVGKVEVTKSGYFVSSIPYDEGFKVLVDGKKVKLDKIDTAFLGFKINEGLHEIEIVYNAPWKKEASIISIIGLVIFILNTAREHKRTTH